MKKLNSNLTPSSSTYFKALNKEGPFERYIFPSLSEHRGYFSTDAAAQCARLAPCYRYFGCSDVTGRLYLLQHHTTGGIGRRGNSAVLCDRLRCSVAGGKPVQRVLTRDSL